MNYADIQNCDDRVTFAEYMDIKIVRATQFLNTVKASLASDLKSGELHEMVATLNMEINSFYGEIYEIKELNKAKPRMPSVVEILEMSADNLIDIETLLKAKTKASDAILNGQKMIRRLETLKAKIEEIDFDLRYPQAA